MSRTRLPRPGEVEEHCRLCAAVLQISVENPRRVCAACGEVNLPSVAPPPSLGSPRLFPQSVSSKELRLLPLGAAPALLAVVVAGIGSMFEKNAGHAFELWLRLAISVSLPALVVSFAVGIWLASNAKVRPLMAGLFWLLGLALAVPVSSLLAWFTILFHGIIRH